MIILKSNNTKIRKRFFLNVYVLGKFDAECMLKNGHLKKVKIYLPFYDSINLYGLSIVPSPLT